LWSRLNAANRILGCPQSIAEGLQAAVEPAGGLVGCSGAGFGLVGDEGFGDRVGIRSGLLRLFATTVMAIT